MEKEDDFYEFLPKSELTEEEFAEAKRIYGETKSPLQVVKYINSIHPDLGLKLSKLYYELYIEDKPVEENGVILGKYMPMETTELICNKNDSIKNKPVMKEFNEVYQQWFNEVYLKKYPDLIDATQYFYELGQKESKKQYESMGVALVTENNEVFYDDLKRICSSAFKPGDRVGIYIKKKEPLSFD